MTEAELAEAQRREYSTYVATEPIFIGGARAYNPGDGVSTTQVENGIVSAAQVTKVTTKAGKAAQTTGNED